MFYNYIVKTGKNNERKESIEKMEEEKEGNTQVGCCRWIKSELATIWLCFGCFCRNTTPKTRMFDSVDPNGQTIDFDKSFQTGGVGLLIIGAKLVIWGLIVSTFVLGFFDADYAYWYLAYVSHWTLAYSVVYSTFSLIVSFCGRGKRNSGDPSSSTCLIRAVWIMYNIAVVHGLLVVILFWVTEYGPNYELRYYLIMVHGVTFALTFIDGAIINHIPVRLSQALWVMFFGILFIAWTLIQALIPIDNPNRDDGEDHLYNILNWEDEPLESAIVSALVVFVAMPLLTALFWGLSLALGHRYVSNDHDDDSVFDRHRLGASSSGGGGSSHSYPKYSQNDIEEAAPELELADSQR